MVAFLFTVVNTQYGTGRIIEPDLAVRFAAKFLSSGTIDTRIEEIGKFCQYQGI
jgi:hypothetical protein